MRALGFTALFVERALDLMLVLVRAPLLPPGDERREHQRVCGKPRSTLLVAGSGQRAVTSIWFERVFAKREGKWIYLSHRTVHGPIYGADRHAVSDKQRLGRS